MTSPTAVNSSIDLLLIYVNGTCLKQRAHSKVVYFRAKSTRPVHGQEDNHEQYWTYRDNSTCIFSLLCVISTGRVWS
jgi:hypothetical protein